MRSSDSLDAELRDLILSVYLRPRMYAVPENVEEILWIVHRSWSLLHEREEEFQRLYHDLSMRYGAYSGYYRQFTEANPNGSEADALKFVFERWATISRSLGLKTPDSWDDVSSIVEEQKTIKGMLASSTRQPTLSLPREGRTIGVVGDVYRFLVMSEDTEGRYAQWEAIVPPGGGPPPHIHSREEEGFYILEGEITIQFGDERLVATAGTFANMPVGSLHSFKNESGKPARMLITVAPAGLEQMFLEIGQPVAADATAAPAPSQAEFEKLLAVASRYGVTIKLPEN